MDRRTVTIRKDIRIPQFSHGNPVSVKVYHDDVEPLFQVEVNTGGHLAGSDDYISVMINRCWFYPHFIPGVVFNSLGWTVSVVDVEGKENFQKYFGKKDFLSVDWVEDFFKDAKFGLEQFVCRSTLMKDVDVLLPEDVLTIRCEVFYEYYMNGTAALRCQETEVNNFLLRAFTLQPVCDEECGFEFDELSQTDDSSQQKKASTLDNPNTPDNQTKVMNRADPCLSFGEEHLEKSLRVMEESFDELSQMFDTYRKLSQLRDFEELLQPNEEKVADMWWKKEDFTQDIDNIARIFYDLHKTANAFDKNKGGDFSFRLEKTINNAAEKVNNLVIENWWDENDAVQKISLQIVRWLGLHKNLQEHFARRKWWYREEYLKEHQPEKLGESTKSIGYSRMEDEIKEMFFLYKEVQNISSDILKRKYKNDSEKKRLHIIILADVMRFFTVFLNTFRVLSLRLYWPICVLSSMPQSESKQEVKPGNNSEFDEKGEYDNKPRAKKEIRDESICFQKVEVQSKIGLQAIQDSSETIKETIFPDDLSGKNESGSNSDSTRKEKLTDTSEIFDAVEDEMHDRSENLNFSIETKDGKSLKVPFQEDSTTLGWLMCTVSPVFKSMMTSLMQERINRRIRLVDIDHETLQGFIHYLQTEKVNVQSLEECSLLYSMAHEYQVPHLKIACAAQMARFLNHENVDDVGEFAKFFDEDMLISLTEAYNFPWRVLMAALGLQNLKLSPLSSQSTWAEAAAKLPANLNEVMFPKKDGDYEFYNF